MEPSDVAGECNAHLYLSDRGRDRKVRCSLPAGHDGIHRHVAHGVAEGGGASHGVITWARDERRPRHLALVRDEQPARRGAS